MGRNYVAGTVTASANLRGTVISGNSIAADLTCTANVPAPTDGGVRTWSAGERFGQTCAVITFSRSLALGPDRHLAGEGRSPVRSHDQLVAGKTRAATLPAATADAVLGKSGPWTP